MSESKFKPPVFIFVEHPPFSVWCRSCRDRHKVEYLYDQWRGIISGMSTIVAAYVKCPRQNFKYALMLRSKANERAQSKRRLP